MICTQCGTIHHKEDKHICNSENIPEKGTEYKPQLIAVAIKEQ